MGEDRPHPLDVLPGFAEARRKVEERKALGEVGVYEIAAMYLRQAEPQSRARMGRDLLEEVLGDEDFPPAVAAALEALGESGAEATTEAEPWRLALVAACQAIQQLTAAALALDDAVDASLTGWSGAIELAADAGANREALARQREALASEAGKAAARAPRNATGRFVLSAWEADPNRTAAQFLGWVDRVVASGGYWGDFVVEEDDDGRYMIGDGRPVGGEASRDSLRKNWDRWARKVRT